MQEGEKEREDSVEATINSRCLQFTIVVIISVVVVVSVACDSIYAISHYISKLTRKPIGPSSMESINFPQEQ